MNLETKTPLIFWHIRGHCTIKTPCKFKNSNFLVSPKTAYIEGSLPKPQLVHCSTLWHNSVDKHRLCRSSFSACFYITACLGPAHRFAPVVFTRRKTCRSTKKSNDKDGSEYRKMLCSAKLWEKKRSLHCLSSDANIRKEWINFI